MSQAARIRAGCGSLLLALFLLSLLGLFAVHYDRAFALLNGGLLALLGAALIGALRARNWAIAASCAAVFLLFLAFGPVLEAGRAIAVLLVGGGLLVVLPRWLQGVIQRRVIVNVITLLVSLLVGGASLLLSFFTIPSAFGGGCCAFEPLPAESYRATVQPANLAAGTFTISEEVQFDAERPLYEATRTLTSTRTGLLGRTLEFAPLNPGQNRIASVELADGEVVDGWFEPEQTEITLRNFPPSTTISTSNYEATTPAPNTVTGAVEDARDPISLNYLPPAYEALRPLLAPFQWMAIEGGGLTGFFGFLLAGMALMFRPRPRGQFLNPQAD